MISPDVKIIKLYEQAVIIPEDDYDVGVHYFDFRILTGSRLFFTVLSKSLPSGCSVQFDLLNSFTIDGPGNWDNVLSFTHDVLGYQKRVLTDFNKMFQVKMTVTGGTVSLIMALAVFDNAMTTVIENAEIDVHLTDKTVGIRPYDIVRMGDGTNQVKLNSDGSFNVNIVDAVSDTPENVVSKFNETPAVGSGIETLIVGYTVPPLLKSRLQRIEFSGENIGSYSVYLNGDLFAKKHTWFNGPMHGEFSFLGTTEEGPKLNAGDLIELKVIHQRPTSANFTGRIQLIELG
jgi:hypothetical protein